MFHAIGEDNLRRILKCPWTMIAPDGEVPNSAKRPPIRAVTGFLSAFSRNTAAFVEKRVCGPIPAGKGFLVRESSPDAAAQVLAKLKERFGRTAPAKIADEAFSAADKYLRGMCVFRKGSFVVGFANLPAGRDGPAETE